MIEDPIRSFLFVLANFSIAGGLVFLALCVAPRIRRASQRTRVGGMGFFLLVGLAHIRLGVAALFQPDVRVGEVAVSWVQLAIYLPAAICVWMFVTGLYIEGRFTVPDDTDPTHDAGPSL